MSSKNIIVWEWEDECFTWRPYPPHISNFIEQSSSGPLVNLGKADTKFRHYDVDFRRMIQTRNNTGTSRRIERHLFPEHSPIGQGVVWAYEGDHPGQFNEYASVFADVLEDAYQSKTKEIDMSTMPPFMPYKVNLKKMVQTRKETGKKRKIKRELRMNPVQYMVDTSTTPLPATAIYGPPSGAGNGVGAMGGGATGVSSTPAAGITSTMSALSGAVSKFSSTVGSYFGSNPITGTTAPTSNPTYPSHHASPTTTGVKTRHSTHVAHMTHTAPPGSTNPYSTHTAAPGSTNPYSLPAHGGAVPKSMGSRYAHMLQTTGGLGSGVQKIPPKTNLPPSDTIPNVTSKTPVRKKKKTKDSEFDEIIKHVVKVLKDPPKDEDCCICMSELQESSHYVNEKQSVVIKLKCGHMFHKPCLKAMYDNGHKDQSVTCPSCKTIYGIKQGICPAGTMRYDTLHHSLPGHEDCDTIRVQYNISPGTQGPEHPHPGQRYVTQGFPRIGFLPASTKGFKTLKLLIKAWERRLTFTIAQSVTTGQQNCVVWNGIHHKTEMQDMSGHGYPAPNYLDNVRMECAALGVYDSEDEEEMDEEEDVKSSAAAAANDSDESDL